MGSYGKLNDHLRGKCSKNAGIQGSTISNDHMTIGFGPFELSTCGLLQRVWEHSQYYQYTVGKQNGGGAKWLELLLY